MTTQSFVVVDAADTEQMLLRLNAGLSATALSEFLLGQVGPWLQERARQRFQNEGDDVTGKWQPLNPSTVRIREMGAQAGLWSVGPEHPINKRTGELEDYMTRGVGGTIPWGEGSSLVFPDPGSVKGAELKEKLKTAARGKSNPRTPARPVLGVNERDLELVLGRLHNHIIESASGRPKI